MRHSLFDSLDRQLWSDILLKQLETRERLMAERAAQQGEHAALLAEKARLLSERRRLQARLRAKLSKSQSSR